MRAKEGNLPSGRLFAYEGKVTIDEHLSGIKNPDFVADNLVPTTGRIYLLDTGSAGDIDSIRIGDDGSARNLAMTGLVSEQFSALPTDSRLTGTKRVYELFVGTGEANFIHREIGLFAGTVLMSTLVISPEFEKTALKTRSYIYEMGWF